MALKMESGWGLIQGLPGYYPIAQAPTILSSAILSQSITAIKQSQKLQNLDAIPLMGTGKLYQNWAS
jgi:hypothetical protein